MAFAVANITPPPSDPLGPSGTLALNLELAASLPWTLNLELAPALRALKDWLGHNHPDFLNNTRRLDLQETIDKIASLQYIQNELNGIPNLV